MASCELLAGGISTGAFVTKVPTKVGLLPAAEVGYQPGASAPTSIMSLLVAAEGRRAADRERVVGVHRAFDLVAGGEGDLVAVFLDPLFAFVMFPDRVFVAPLLPGQFSTASRRLMSSGERVRESVGDRVQGLELGEVHVVEEARRFEGGDDRGLALAGEAGRADPERARQRFAGLDHARRRRRRCVAGLQVDCPVAGISSIAYFAPVLPGTGRRFVVDPCWLTALGVGHVGAFGPVAAVRGQVEGVVVDPGLGRLEGLFAGRGRGGSGGCRR